MNEFECCLNFEEIDSINDYGDTVSEPYIFIWFNALYQENMPEGSLAEISFLGANINGQDEKDTDVLDAEQIERCEAYLYSGKGLAQAQAIALEAQKAEENRQNSCFY